MHNILVCPDVHFSVTSSIVRGRGKKYSSRLENCIASVNWVEQTAQQYNCSSIFYLGDFFNQNVLDSEQITALREIQFADIKHYAIVGNHEISTTNNEFNSLNTLANIQSFDIIDKPMSIEGDNIRVDLLPYDYNCDADINKYFGDVTNKSKILFSHNMLRGINFGGHISEDGLDVSILEKSYNLVLNGHIHTHSQVAKNIWNVGLLTGQNFTEDAFTSKHVIAILDLDTLNVEFAENPYAYNFVKVEINDEKDLKKLSKLPTNCVISIKCDEKLAEKARELIPDEINSRFTLTREITDADEESKIDLTVDPLQKLRECCLQKLGSSDILLQELDELALQGVVNDN